MKEERRSQLARFLITCPDRPGIVAKVSTFLAQQNANITELDQHSDADEGTFFMRLEFQADFKGKESEWEEKFEKEIASAFQMDWKILYEKKIKKMAIFVSKYDHVLLEILWRHASQALRMEIPFIISNHPDLENIARHFNVPFHHIPNSNINKKEGEEKILSLCEGKIDGIILARYMQILSPQFVDKYPGQIINIHHSFLPAFVGANPYQQAYDKGVKLIGATAHYVTEDLDMGPIIAQEVKRVSHRLNVAQFRQLGQEVERAALARAVKAHLEDRIIVNGNKTIVFE